MRSRLSSQSYTISGQFEGPAAPTSTQRLAGCDRISIVSANTPSDPDVGG